MDSRPILFLDSGAGGLPYVDAVRELVPDERFVYVADTAHFPYGARDEAEIRAVLVDLLDRSITQFDPGLVVLACNTASVVALAELRRRFEVPVVGVVPAVKPAAAAAEGGAVAILSTERTADAEYLAGLIDHHAGDASVEIVPAAGLVEFVEERLTVTDEAGRRAAVGRALGGLRRADLDAVVLGCTHFTHLSCEIAAELGEGVRVIDSRDGVARRVATLLGRGEGAGGGRADRQAPAGGPAPAGAGAGGAADAGRLYVTGEPQERYVRLARRHGLRFEGRLP